MCNAVGDVGEGWGRDGLVKRTTATVCVCVGGGGVRVGTQHGGFEGAGRASGCEGSGKLLHADTGIRRDVNSKQCLGTLPMPHRAVIGVFKFGTTNATT